MKTSTIVLIIVGVLVLVGAIIAIVMLTKKDNSSANKSLEGVFNQKISEQGGSLGQMAGAVAGVFGGGMGKWVN